MHEQLSPVEGTQVGRRRVAQADDAQQLVVDRVGNRDGVGELLGRVDAVATADRHVRIGGRAWGLSCACGLNGGESHHGQ